MLLLLLQLNNLQRLSNSPEKKLTIRDLPMTKFKKHLPMLLQSIRVVGWSLLLSHNLVS